MNGEQVIVESPAVQAPVSKARLVTEGGVVRTRSTSEDGALFSANASGEAPPSVTESRGVDYLHPEWFELQADAWGLIDQRDRMCVTEANGPGDASTSRGPTQEGSAPMPDKRNARYAVQFTPVGWFVIDTAEAHDPIAQFGLGPDEYTRAKDEAARLNGASDE